MSKSYPLGGFGYQEPQDTKTQVESRKRKFDQINRFITDRGGWVVSIPGDREVRFETLPGSLARDVQARFPQYQVFPDGEGERILSAAIVEHFVRRADGELEPLTEQSTKPVAETRHHAGITSIRRFVLHL